MKAEHQPANSRMKSMMARNTLNSNRQLHSNTPGHQDEDANQRWRKE